MEGRNRLKVYFDDQPPKITNVKAYPIESKARVILSAEDTGGVGVDFNNVRLICDGKQIPDFGIKKIKEEINYTFGFNEPGTHNLDIIVPDFFGNNATANTVFTVPQPRKVSKPVPKKKAPSKFELLVRVTKPDGTGPATVEIENGPPAEKKGGWFVFSDLKAGTYKVLAKCKPTNSSLGGKEERKKTATVVFKENDKPKRQKLKITID